MLPGLDGFTFAQRIRETDGLSAIRIIMLTARTQSEDIVRGLEAGADDYVTKPFDRKVLLARVRAVLRRGLPVTEGVEFDGLRIDEANVVATLRGKPLDLTGGEFKLLVKLVAHRGRVFARPPDERTIDVQVANLRRKLGAWGSHIETIRGVGYRISV
jgi:DNA-binding response OmpR family regulator